MIIAVRIIYRILYELSTDTGEITKSSELYCNMSIAVDFYPVQMVKHRIEGFRKRITVMNSRNPVVVNHRILYEYTTNTG
jgi:hypothetical protein